MNRLSLLAPSAASPSASVTQLPSGGLSRPSKDYPRQDKDGLISTSSIELPSLGNSLRSRTAKLKGLFKSGQSKELNTRSTGMFLETTSSKSYTPSGLRMKVLHELRNHRLARDLDQIQVFSALRYRRNGTLLIRFNLAGSIGDEGDTLLLYPTSGVSQIAEDENRMQPPTRRKGVIGEKPERTSIPALMPSFFAEDDGRDPVYFSIMSSKEADKQVLKSTRMGFPNDIKNHERLSLDRIVVLAFTISSQSRELSREGGRGETFLNAMWNGLEACVGDVCLSDKIPAVIKGFGGNLMEFHFDVWQAKQVSSGPILGV